MKLTRLMELAGVKLDEASLAKYNEPKANHKVKTGGEEKKAKEGKSKVPGTAGYKEPKAGKGPKKEKEVKAPEGKSKVPSTKIYKDNNSTK